MIQSFQSTKYCLLYWKVVNYLLYLKTFKKLTLRRIFSVWSNPFSIFQIVQNSYLHLEFIWLFKVCRILNNVKHVMKEIEEEKCISINKSFEKYQYWRLEDVNILKWTNIHTYVRMDVWIYIAALNFVIIKIKNFTLNYKI